jgi:translation initiation factor 1
MHSSKLVYSTETGGMCGACGKPLRKCECAESGKTTPADGTVRIRREIKGRAGKTVTTIQGLPLRGGALEALAGDLKRKCGAGGTVKDGIVVIQGDRRSVVKSELEAKGYKVKIAGG